MANTSLLTFGKQDVGIRGGKITRALLKMLGFLGVKWTVTYLDKLGEYTDQKYWW